MGCPFVCIACRLQKCLQKILRQPLSHHLFANAHHIYMIVLHTLMGTLVIMDNGRPDSGYFVARNRSTHSGSAKQKINMVPLQVAMGFSQGIMPLISYNYASGNHRRMKETIFFTIKTLLPFLVVVSLGYFAGAGVLTRAFMDNEAIVAYGTKFLRGFCLGLPFLCMDFLAVGVFQAVGMGKAALSFAILRKIVLEIPALYLLNSLFPLYGLSYAQLVAELVLSIASVIMLARIFRRMQREDGALREGAEGGSSSYGK